MQATTTKGRRSRINIPTASLQHPRNLPEGSPKAGRDVQVVEAKGGSK